MKKNTKLLTRNILVTLCLLSSASACALLFWQELNATVKQSVETVIGEVVEIRGQAQRRYGDQSLWTNIKGQESLHNLDAIRTDETSNAYIVLKTLDEDGIETYDEIRLGPQTYIILDMLGSARNIQFVGGNISASGSNGLTVTTEDTVVTADKGSISLNKKEGEATSVSVDEGEAEVLVDGKQTLVNTESILKIDEETGTTTKIQTVIFPRFPKSNTLLLTYASTRQVDFSWDMLAQWDTPILEVSKNPTFPPKEGFQVQADSVASLELDSGQWYWRIKNQDTEDVSTVNFFTIDKERPATLISPSPDTVIPFRGAPPAVNLQWQKSWFAESHTVEIARDALFSQIERSNQVNGATLLVKNLPPGQWWWRVSPNYRRGILDSAPSKKAQSFSFEEQEGYSQTSLIFPFNESSFSALKVQDGVDFRWKDQESIQSYKIEISRTSNFAQIVASAEGAENWKTLLKDPEPGKYYWHVKAVSVDGLPVPTSPTRNFEIKPITGTIELINPAQDSNEVFTPYTPHTFVWDSNVQGTSKFILQSANQRERTRIVENLVQGQFLTVPMPGEGNYEWYIELLDTKGRTILTSQRSRFQVQREFTAPELLNPKPGESISLTNSTQILISWSPTPRADAYRVTIKDPENHILERYNRIDGLVQAFSLANTNRTGTYTVELTALRDNPPAGILGTSETASYRFRIDEISQYSAAILVSPEDNSSLNVLNLLRGGIRFSWQQDPLLSLWTLELIKEGKSRIYQTDVPSITLNERLESGLYTWKVRSWDELGQEAPISQTYQFVLNELPKPGAPTVLFPEENQNIDMTGAKNLRFSWQQENDTDYYEIALYPRDSRTALLQEKNLRTSTHTIDDLKILNVGDFDLEIIAYKEYLDLGIIQRSTTTRVPFTLSLNISKKAPRIITNELQYAD